MTSFMMKTVSLKTLVAEIKRLEKHLRFNFKNKYILSFPTNRDARTIFKFKNKYGGLPFTL